MDLENVEAFSALDKQNMIDQIFNLPQQLEDAWTLGLSLPLPEIQSIQGVVITGMGGSAIGGDLLSVYAALSCPVPVMVHRGYDLPAWARGPQTLVIAVSHSGNTEETLTAFEQALANGCCTLAIATGGKLAQRAVDSGQPAWIIPSGYQPRTAVGYDFGLLLAAFFRLGLLPNPLPELRETLHALRNQQTNLLPEVPVAFNPAKRLAGQMVGRWVVIFAADHLEPVARRWKSQLCEGAKAWGQFEFLPEADHNSLAGLNHPEAPLMQTMVLFLEAHTNHPRNSLRLGLTRQIFMQQGINTDFVQAKGETRMAHIWTTLHFGDYVSYYLAMAYGEDPTPVEMLDTIKDELGKIN